MSRIIKPSRSGGFTLTTVLLAITGLFILTSGALFLALSSRNSSWSLHGNYHLKLTLESGKEDAFSSLLIPTNRNTFLTHQNQDSYGNPEYYLISWFDPDSWTWNHQPLYSGAQLETIQAPSGSDKYIPYTDHYDSPSLHEDTMIQLHNLRPKDSNPSEMVFFNAPRIPLTTNSDGSSITSYSYWIEDLNGLLDYEALSFNATADPTTSYEASQMHPPLSSPLLSVEEMAGRTDLKVLDQRHLALNVFSDQVIRQYEYPLNFKNPLSYRKENPHLPEGAPSAPAHPFQDLLITKPAPYTLSLPTVLSETSTEYAELKHYMTQGVADTLELEVVPYGHNYQNAGTELKANLNAFLQQAQSAPSDAVNDLSVKIKNVRGFKDSDEEYRQAGIHPAPDKGNVSHTRYGGLRESESYTKTLAASIIDYADTDSRSTSNRYDFQINHEALYKAGTLKPKHVALDTSKSNYRGLDAQPLLTETTRRYQIVANYEENGQDYAVIQVRTFLELWNPSNQTLHGYVYYEFHPDLKHAISEEQSSPTQFPLGKETLYYWGGVVTISPNEYRVIEVTNDHSPSVDFIGEKGETGYSNYEIPVSTWKVELHRLQSAPLNYDKLFWHTVSNASSAAPTDKQNFIEVCGFQTPYMLDNDTIYADGTNKDGSPSYKKHSFTCISIPLRYDNIVGDPRNSLYSLRTLYSGGYHRSYTYGKSAGFGGQNHLSLTNDRRMNYEAKFPDGVYNSSFGKPPSTQTNTSNSRSRLVPGEKGYVYDTDLIDKDIPVEAYPASQPSRYVQPISNRGRYISLGELGNIYDPAQWKHLRRQSTHNNDLTPNDRVDSSNYATRLQANSAIKEDGGTLIPYNDYGQGENQQHLANFGGGITLAIGSPEFNAFDPYADPDYTSKKGGGREGYEAARLLDQFRVTDTEIRSLKAKINLNTAPKKVLSALFSGFTHESDPVIGTFTRQPLLKKNGENSLTEGIINHRGQAPFLSLSDIALTRGSLEGTDLYLFGEKAFYEKNSDLINSFGMEQQVWRDEGREELFRRTCDLFTTQSRSYRIHLKAEYRMGETTKTAAQTIDVTVHPSYSHNSTLNTHYDVNRNTQPKVIIHSISEK